MISCRLRLAEICPTLPYHIHSLPQINNGTIKNVVCPLTCMSPNLLQLLGLGLLKILSG